MSTVFFTQNVKKGGLDTFIQNLILSWPTAEDITLLCNSSHPGVSNLKNNLDGHVTVVEYNFWIAQDITERLKESPRIFILGFRLLFWLFGFPYLVLKTAQLFRQYPAEQMMVINGGYPGGDACLAASVGWRIINPNRPAWHNFHNLVLPYSKNPLRWFKEKLIDYCVAWSIAGFVTVSRACMETLAERPQCLKSNHVFIYNGINTSTKTFQRISKPEFCQFPAKFLILMPAVFESRKGHGMMIRAMEEIVKQVPKTTLLICGDGTDAEIEKVKQLRSKSSVKRQIRIQGYHHNILETILLADILVLPSQSQESFGYTAVEAMACGRPVVATNVGGLPEVVDDGVTGFLVDPNDIEKFAERIIILLKNKALRNSMGRSGKKRYKILFHSSVMSLKYQNLISNHSSMDN